MKQDAFRIRYLPVLSLAFGWTVFQSAIGGYMHGNTVGQIIANHLPLGSVFFLMIVALGANPLLGRAAFTTRELALMWAVVTASAAVPGYGLMEFFFPFLAAPLNFATTENQWRETVFPHLPSWLYVSDPRAVDRFFVGLQGGDRVPWEAWRSPSIYWLAVGVSFFFGLMWWSVIVRRQWVERERYAFPLVQVAHYLTETDAPERPLSGTLRSPLLWAAMGAMFLVHLLNGLHNLFPTIPAIPTTFPLEPLITQKPWSRLVQNWPLWPHVYFSVVGVTYFLHLDVSLSLWFFFASFKFQEVFFEAHNIAGVNTQQQVLGAVTVLAAVALWNMRRHLADVWRKTLHPNDASVDDSSEPSAYRTAVVGAAVGFGALIGLYVVAGMSLWFAVLFVGLLIAMATAVAWQVANAGLLLVNVGMSPWQWFTTILGTRPIGARNLVLLAYDRSRMEHWTSESLMPYVLQNFRLYETHRLHPRGLPWIQFAAILLAIAAAYVASMHWIYRQGANNLEYWVYRWIGRVGLDNANAALQTPFGPNRTALVSMGIGAAVTGFLVFMRHQFLWWPLHPLGYTLGVTYAPFHLWFSVLVGWAVKLLIVRFGGFGIYRRGRPFFLGLVFGEYFMTGIWSFIGLWTRVPYWGLPH